MVYIKGKTTTTSHGGDMTNRTPNGDPQRECRVDRSPRQYERRRRVALLAALLPAALCAVWLPRAVNAQPVTSPNIFQRPTAGSADLGAASPADLTFHGGSVMTAFTAYLIYWLPPGTHFSSPISDANYEQVIEQYFQNVGGTPFYNIVTQYPGMNGTPPNAVTLGGSVVDTNPYPHAGTLADPLLDADVVNEIKSVIVAQSWPTGLGTMYFVFTGSGIESCFDASHTFCTPSKYCAYHSNFPFNSDVVVYANAADRHSTCGQVTINITGDPAADAEVSLVSHEHLEAVTDPLFAGWFDSSGFEVADKCQFNFQFGDATTPNVFLNGHPYRLQSEWSNAANQCAFGLSCPLSPAPNCRTAGSSGLLIASPNDFSKHALKWTWSKGASTSIAEFGLPTTTTSYALCIYDGTSLVLDVEAPDGQLCGTQSCWSAVSTGYKFKNKAGFLNGLTGIALKASADSKSKITFKGKGATLPLPTLGLSGGPVTVQLVNNSSAVCFEGDYSGSDISVNDPSKFKASHH